MTTQEPRRFWTTQPPLRDDVIPGVDLTGTRYRHWTVVGRIDRSQVECVGSGVLWACRCDCGVFEGQKTDTIRRALIVAEEVDYWHDRCNVCQDARMATMTPDEIEAVSASWRAARAAIKLKPLGPQPKAKVKPSPPPPPTKIKTWKPNSKPRKPKPPPEPPPKPARENLTLDHDHRLAGLIRSGLIGSPEREAEARRSRLKTQSVQEALKVVRRAEAEVKKSGTAGAQISTSRKYGSAVRDLFLTLGYTPPTNPIVEPPAVSTCSPPESGSHPLVRRSPVKWVYDTTDGRAVHRRIKFSPLRRISVRKHIELRPVLDGFELIVGGELTGTFPDTESAMRYALDNASTYVSSIRRVYHPMPARQWRSPYTGILRFAEHRERFRAMYEAGTSVVEVGAAFRLSPKGVIQLAKFFGFERRQEWKLIREPDLTISGFEEWVDSSEGRGWIGSFDVEPVGKSGRTLHQILTEMLANLRTL